jgi:hypothetical protein
VVTREWLFRNSAQCPQLLDGDRAKREWRLSVDQDAAAGTTPPDLPAESAYRVTVLRKSRRDWRDRLGIDEATALRAHEDVKMALRDVARRQLYNISEGVLDEFVYAAFVATLNALDIAVPQGLIRKVAYVNGNGNRVTVPRAEATSR